MMRVIAICVLVGVLRTNAAPLTSEQKLKLDSYNKICVKQSNVTDILLEQAHKGIYNDDPTLKNYIYCFSQRIGFQDTNGVVQTKVFERKLNDEVEDKRVLSKLVEQCTGQKESPEDTAFNILKCLRESAPDIDFFKVAPEIVYVSNEQAQKYLVRHKECAAEVKIDREIIENAGKTGTIYDDDKFKDYIFCMTKKQGILNEDGTINKDKYYKCFEQIINDAALLKKLDEKCLVQQDTPENTAFLMSKCFNENSPVHIDVFPRDILVPDELAKRIIEDTKACIKETGADKELVIKSREETFIDPKLKDFTFCMSKKGGYINDNGDLQLEVIKVKTFMFLKDLEIVQRLIDQCAVKRETPQETAFNTVDCIKKKSPGRLVIPQFKEALSEGQKEKGQVIKECLEETGVSNEAVLSARKGDFQDDSLLKEYFFCLNKKFGAINEKGEFNHDLIRKGLTETFSAEKVEKIMEKCLKSEGTPINKSYESFKCYYTNYPEAENMF